MNKKRPKLILGRLVSILVVAFLVGAGTFFTGPAARQASAQEELAAAIVEGDCGNPGDVAADLRPFTASEGGALTSFTTIDLAIGDLTGGGYAVVAGDPSSPDACGDISGEGEDVYVEVRSQSDANLGGIAWLHARTDRTQVSIFLGENLGGSGTTPPVEPTEDPDQPEPPADDTPVPPDDETPVPTRTPRAEPTEPAGATETYDSPTYGYSITYDTEVWQVEKEESTPSDTGTVDTFVLRAPMSGLLAEFYGLPADPRVTALDIVANVERNIKSNPSVQETSDRIGPDGEPIRGGDENHAYLAIDFSFQSDNGNTYQNVYHVEAWIVPETGGALIMIYQAPQSEYDAGIDTLETLTGGVTIPE
jgi:hypothetical protein